MQDLLEGKKESLIPWLVDVRDIGRAHVLAAENQEAKGRYIVSNNHTIGSARLFKALKQAFPDYAIPEAKEEPSKQILEDPLKVCHNMQGPAICHASNALAMLQPVPASCLLSDELQPYSMEGTEAGAYPSSCIQHLQSLQSAVGNMTSYAMLCKPAL